MKRMGPSYRAVTVGVPIALLAGCGGAQPPIGAPLPMPQSSAIVTHADRSGSWMLPEAKSEDLLYVANLANNGFGTGTVGIYTYIRKANLWET